jgi:hypothetical protein
MWVVVGSVTLIVIIATYLTWTAARVDRLHARAAAAFSALDAQSTRRAAAAAEFGEQHALADVQSGAKAVLGAHRDERELAENDLTKTLRSAIAKVESAREHNSLEGVMEASGRLALARQVHNDLVRDALAMRRRPVVRLLRLGRRHPQPRFFDIDEPTLDNGSARS